MCPHCGRDAPLVYRGALAYCSACDRPRVPLSATGVNLTGKPAKVGGTLASVLGWVVLAVMLAIALILGAFFQAIFPPGAVVGWAIGGVIAAIGIAAATILLLGGRFLHRTGDRAAMEARKAAVTALASGQKGILRADRVAGALGISTAEADGFLTELSRQPDGGVVLEVDNDGRLFYRFPAFAPELPWPDLSAAGPSPVQGGVRVARTELVEPVRVATRTEVVPGVRVEASSDGTVLDDEPVESPGSTKRTQA